MENIKDKNKNYFYLYELFGMAILSASYNMSQEVYKVLFVVMMMSWDLSCSHFNGGVTIGAFIFSRENWKKTTLPFFLTLLVQIIGSLIGILITFSASKITYDNNKPKVIFPAVKKLCPLFKGEKQESECLVTGLYSQVFFAEFIGSLMFITSWLIIKN